MDLFLLLLLIVMEAIIKGIDLRGGLFRRGRFVCGIVAVVVIRGRIISGWGRRSGGMVVGIVDGGRLSGGGGRQVDAERVKGRG